MAYRIEYDYSTRKYEVIHKNTFLFPILLVICYFLFYMLTSAFWPDGRALIREMIIPGDNAVTTEALHSMTDELRAGAEFGDAVYAFCCEVIDGEKNTN